MHHGEQLFQTPMIERNPPKSIRSFVNHIRTHFHSLKTLKLPVDSWDISIILHILPKLGRRLDYEKTLKSHNNVYHFFPTYKLWENTWISFRFRPNKPINTNMLSMSLRHLQIIKSNLADPTFHKSSSIQMLIENGPTLSTFSIDQLNISTSLEKDVILKKTQLGWIIGRSVNSISPSQHRHLTNLEENIAKF